MPNLMGDDVGLGKVPGGTQLAIQIVEEAQIEVHLAIGGAVEGAYRRAGGAAGRGHPLAEQHQHRLLVPLALLGQDALPGLLGVRQHHGDEFRQLLLLGGEAGGLLGNRAAQLQQIYAQHSGAEEDHHTHRQHDPTQAGAQ